MDGLWQDYQLVDLTVPLGEDMPCWWPGLSPFYATRTMNFESWRGPARSRLLSLEEHTGTHFDAQCHVFADDDDEAMDGRPLRELTSSDVPLERFIGEAVVIDVPPSSALPGHSPWIDIDALDVHEAASGPLRPGQIVLFRTGWSERYYRRFPEGREYVADVVAGKSAGWPAPSSAIIEAIAARGVSVIGVDTPSIGAIHDPIPGHRAAARGGILPVENLTGLSALPSRGATFMFLPLNVAGGTGSPGRAIGLLPR
jgi:kynurenine formamidase